MKKTMIMLVAASAVAVSSLAVASSGVYINAGAGFSGIKGSAFTAVKAAQTAKDTTVDESGFAWIAGLGYQLNNNFAVEADYLSLPNITSTKDKKTADYVKSAYNIDLLLKAMLPVGANFSLNAKVGAAYAAYTAKSVLIINKKTVKSGANVGTIVPVVGAGASYAIGQHVSVGVNGLYNFAIGKMPSSYVAYGSVSYLF